MSFVIIAKLTKKKEKEKTIDTGKRGKNKHMHGVASLSKGLSENMSPASPPFDFFESTGRLIHVCLSRVLVVVLC